MLYPLTFNPRFVEKMWGGRKIESILGKPLPATQRVGESWELFDFPPGVVEGSKEWVSATVANGPLAGKSLHELVTTYGSELTGDVKLVGAAGQFPILIKFLDAREDLSVQVHPPQVYADAHPGAHLKSEAWYVFQSDAGSRLFKDLAPGTTREQFAAAIENGDVEKHLKTHTVKEGECYYLPSGTVHALGAGQFVAEVQTPSDTTFRVYDFNRVDPGTGTLRKLHVSEALECIDFGTPPREELARADIVGPHATVSPLVDSEYFKLAKVRMHEGVEQPLPYDQPTVWIVLEGAIEVQVETMAAQAFKKGQTVLLPAKMKNPTLKALSECVWLEVTFPI